MNDNEQPERKPKKRAASPGWPQNVDELEAEINRIAPALRAQGYTVEWFTENGERQIRLKAPTAHERATDGA